MNPTRRQVLGAGLAAALGAAVPTQASVVPRKPSFGEGTITSQLKLSIAGYSFRKYLPSGGNKSTMTLFDLCDLAAIWRIDAVEPTGYYFPVQTKEYFHALKAKAFNLGLDISGTAIGNNFCGPTAEERKKQVQDTKDWIDHAVDFGAPVIRVFAGRGNKDVSREQAYAWATDCMKECCDYAGTRGVFLAIENHGYLTEGADDVLKWVADIDHEWFGVNLDTGNFDHHPYRDMARMAPKAINVQVKVNLPKTEGGGKEEADFARIIKILRDANYRGYVALEYEESEDPMTAVPRHLEELRKAIAG